MTKHVKPENYSLEMEKYEKLNQSRYVSIPIVFREVKNPRGQCFYLSAKNMLSTLEQQIQGRNMIFNKICNIF